jgi:hypothetical protein
MSNAEVTALVSAVQHGEPCGMLDPRTMTAAELDHCIAELERFIAAATAAERAAPGSRPASFPSAQPLT